MTRLNRVIAIDFDGTLFKEDYPNIGAPKWEVINAAKMERRHGAQLILWTSRAGSDLVEALDACRRVGLTFDAVNENIPEWVKAFGNDSRKVGASEYWDDKALTPNMVMRKRWKVEK